MDVVIYVQGEMTMRGQVVNIRYVQVTTPYGLDRC